MNRREFLTLTSLAPFIGLKELLAINDSNIQKRTLSRSMTKDKNKVLDLHPKLQYKVISKAGSTMSDGLRLPDLPDGMGAFNVNNNIVLVRNHELHPRSKMNKSAFKNPEKQMKELGRKHYDKYSIGGTTTVVLNRTTKLVKREFLSLSGTNTNCSGGVTPWGTWITCEENIQKKKENTVPHGYAFEVDPRNNFLSDPIPLKNMGRFHHEAIAFDKFHNAYLTEDRSDGLIYKFVPKNKDSLIEGDLYALKIQGTKDSRNWKNSSIKANKRYVAKWIKIEDVDPSSDTMRYEGYSNGATLFSRPEGIVASKDSLYVCCTSGGPLNRGQIWKIIPTKKGETYIELWHEVQDRSSINMPDNIVVAPWGDLIICEDNSRLNRLWGITPKGNPYLIAENNYSGAEFAGVCFSPFDNTLFVNLQQEGLTLSIDGNWQEVIS